MKKLISTMLVCIILLPFAKAQQAKFGFIAGGTLGWMRYESETGAKSTSNVLVGFSAGIIEDFPLGKQFSVQPSLSFLQKGQTNSEAGVDLTMRLDYLELPVNFIYKAPGKAGHFVVGLGPTFSYGLLGKITVKENGETSSGNVHFGIDENNFKSFEMGANILAGYEWKNGLFMQVNFNMGFSNLFHSDPQYPNDPEYLKNSYVGLRIGYFLGKK